LKATIAVKAIHFAATNPVIPREGVESGVIRAEHVMYQLVL